MPLTDIGSVKAWGEPGLDSLNDPALSAAILAASAWIERVTGRLWEQSATLTRFLDGDAATGPGRSVLYLSPRHRPIIHTGTDLVTVQEEGVTLTVAATYDVTKQVFIENANIDLPAALIRNSSPWWSGRMNVKVMYKAGPAAVPAEIKQLANEVAWLIFKSPKWIGRASESKAGSAVSFKDGLTPISQALLESVAVF